MINTNFQTVQTVQRADIDDVTTQYNPYLFHMVYCHPPDDKSVVLSFAVQLDRYITVCVGRI